MLFYGASGHAKVIIESHLEAGGIVSGIFDDDQNKQGIHGYSITGKYNPDYQTDISLIISIGSNSIRKKLTMSIKHSFGKVIHPKSAISRSVRIGQGSVAMAGSIVNAETIIGDHVILNTRSSVDHDCHIGNFCHIAPGATICGGVVVGEGTLIGAGATVLPNLTIGKWVTIGAGSVITKSLPDYAIVKGNPGRIVETQSNLNMLI